MKTKSTTRKLSLNKETITELKSVKMNEVKGGASWTHCYFTCYAAACEETS